MKYTAEIDLSQAVTVQLKCPYIFERELYDFTEDQPLPIGDMELYVYDALAPAGDVYVSVSAHFEDVMLSMPTNMPPRLTTKVKSTYEAWRADEEKSNELDVGKGIARHRFWYPSAGIFSAQPYLNEAYARAPIQKRARVPRDGSGLRVIDETNNAIAQSSDNNDILSSDTIPIRSAQARGYGSNQRKRYFRVAQSLEEVREGRVISRVAKTISDIADPLTGFPLLASVAGPVKWVADGVYSIASFFGLSRPVDKAAPQRVITSTAYGWAKVKGADVIESVSLDPANEVEIDTEPMDSRYDEMDIAALLKHPGPIAHTTWSKTSPP